MTNWIHVDDRLPNDDETVDGRVPIIDDEGCLRFGVVVDNANQPKFIFADTPAVYWMPVTAPKKG